MDFAAGLFLGCMSTLFALFMMAALHTASSGTTTKSSFHNGKVNASYYWTTDSDENDELILKFLVPGTYKVSFENVGVQAYDEDVPAGFTVRVYANSAAQKRVISKYILPENLEITILHAGVEETNEL